MTDKLQWIDEELQNLHQAGLYNNIRTLGSPQGAWLVVDNKKVLIFCSNNYLGLANHPRIVKAARKAAKKYGVGPGAVRTIAGTMELHVKLDHRLAAFKKRGFLPIRLRLSKTLSGRPQSLQRMPWKGRTAI